MEQNPYARQPDEWLDPAADDEAEAAQADTDRTASETMSDTSVDRFLSRDGDDAASDGDTKSRHLSTIGRSLVFKGDLTAEEDLLIQGRVEGSIKHNAANLTIGPHGDVRADIVARRVLVQGTVVGDVRASEAVIIEPSANVRGDIFAPRIGLREGAKFKGRIDMDF